MERNKDENFIAYCQRLTQALNAKEISYEEWVNGVAGDIDYGDESLRRAARVYSMFLEKLGQESIQGLEAEDIIKEIERQKEDLLKERKRLQTVNAEYQANIRNDARGEMFNEKILDAIKALPEIHVKPFIGGNVEGTLTGMLCVADAHYGTEFKLESAFGDVVNEYSPEICRQRFAALAKKVVDDYHKFDYGKLVVLDLGDCIGNMLRMSDIAKLHTGVIDSVLEYSELMAQFLIGLRNVLGVPVQYYGCGGNHDQLRLLQSKRTFDEENIMKIVVAFLKLRLKDIDGIDVADYAECQFINIGGENILAYHGEDTKNGADELEFWENYHNISIDRLILGHFHHKDEQGIGYGNFGDREVIYVPSMMGSDTFAKKIRRLSRAGAKFMLYEDGCGKTWEKTYILN